MFARVVLSTGGGKSFIAMAEVLEGKDSKLFYTEIYRLTEEKYNKHGFDIHGIGVKLIVTQMIILKYHLIDMIVWL